MKTRISAVLIALLAMLGLNAGSAQAITYNQLANNYYVGAGSLCATPKGNSTANGTIITTWSCTGSDLQQWTYQGQYIVHEASGKCLTPQGNASSSNGAVLTLWTCDWSYGSPQRFVVANYPARVYTTWGAKCITNYGGSMANGVYLTLWTCAYGQVPEQNWSI